LGKGGGFGTEQSKLGGFESPAVNERLTVLSIAAKRVKIDAMFDIIAIIVCHPSLCSV
jgi:hypothetical protein